MVKPGWLAQQYYTHLTGGLSGFDAGSSNQRWLWGSLHSSDKRVHTGFETHGQSHLKSETEGTSAPQNGPRSKKKLFIKRSMVKMVFVSMIYVQGPIHTQR